MVVLAFIWIKLEFVWMETKLESTVVDQAADELRLLSSERSVTQRIILTYASVLGSVGDMKARGPALLINATGWVESFSGGLSVGFYFINCAFGWDFYHRLWGGIFLPLFLDTHNYMGATRGADISRNKASQTNKQTQNRTSTF